MLMKALFIGIKIRKFSRKDASAASRIIRDCFLDLDIGGHTRKGIEKQIERNSPGNLIKRSGNVRYFVALDDDKIVGICGRDSHKVQTLFVDVNYHKKGVGKQLLSTVLKDAEDSGLKSIKTWSTFHAEKFYSSFGFEKKKEIHFPSGRKKEIILIEMEKTF